MRVFSSDEADQDPVEEWLLWEQQANLLGFRTSTRPVQIEVARVPRERVELRLAPGAPAAIVERFLRGKHLLYPKHPLNRDASVSFHDEPAAERWTGRYTSSRTLVVADPATLFSLKLPTDHPHPDFAQPEKTELREEAIDALAWVALLDRIDACLGRDPRLVVVREILAVLVPGTEHGFLVRDLGLFRGGGRYLPALSIPWIGRRLAERHGEPFESFWGRHYAEAVGRAKAALFARSGLQFRTPNPQNMLVQLDAGLRPTGRIVLRDLGDADCTTDALECRDVPWTRLCGDLRPETQNSFWAFGEAGEQSVEPAVLGDWYERHDRAYFAELASRFPALAPESGLSAERQLAHWNAALREPGAGGPFAARRSA